MVMIPVRLLAPIVLFLSMVGSYAIRNSMVDVYMMIGIGIVVYLLGKIGVHAGPIGLGVILGPIIEPALVQSMALAKSSSVPHVFLTSPLSITLIALTAISTAWIIWSNQRERRHAEIDD
jgi:putative tricarboxylic transport membrane protein